MNRVLDTVLQVANQFREGDVVSFSNILDRAKLLHQTAWTFDFYRREEGKGAWPFLQHSFNCRLSVKVLYVHFAQIYPYSSESSLR